jgi:Fur family ferric uptake transcriptional regulator
METDGATPLERFRRYLDAHGLPLTRQRLAVAEVLCGAADEVSAEDVARRAALRGFPVGTATVYRTLDLLVRSGIARAHDFGEGFRRYARVAPGRPHERCICAACGRVTELADDRVERLIALSADAVGFKPHRHRLEVVGLCRACQQLNPLARAR